MRVGEDGRIAEQADEVQTFCGKVAIVHPHCCFMESKPGHSNVFVSAYIADPSKINQGDTIEVKARWNAERSNWKAIGTATRSGAVIPPRTSDATAATGGTVSLAPISKSYKFPLPWSYVLVGFGCAVHSLFCSPSCHLLASISSQIPGLGRCSLSDLAR
jgi:hypothetical protein